MSGERFEIGYDDGLLRFVKDNVTNTNLDIVDCLTVLNELNDENEELKSELGNCRECLELNRKSCARHMIENVELKKEYDKLRHYHSNLHDECTELECERDGLKKDVEWLEKESEQLKSKNFILKGELHQLRCGKQEEEIECLSEETIEKFKQDLREGNFLEFTAR